MGFGFGGEFVGGPTAPGTGGGGGSGTVTSVAVNSSNGLAGTVTNPTTAAAITLSTTVTGVVLSGNGTAISAATTTGTGSTVVLSASPTLTGVPLAPTAAANTNTTQLATTAFVQTAISGLLTGPLTGDVITSGNAATLVGTSNVESIIRANTIDQLAPAAANVNFNGFTTSNLAQAILASQPATAGQLAGLQLPYIVSGCVWTADSSGSSLNGSMTAGTVMIKGILLTVAAVTAHAFTAANDCYIDLKDNGDGTANITYTSVPNITMSPALAGGGTALNTIRVAIISTSTVLTTGANNIIQGATNSTVGNGGWAGTVAAGSNGNPINTSTLSVTITSGACTTGGGECTVAHASGQTYTITFTSASGTTGTVTLSGVVVVSGTTSNTVSTGDVVKGVGVVGCSDLLGNRIFPATPGPSGLIGNSFTIAAYTNTLTSGNNPIPNFVAPFIVPPGPSRLVKFTLSVPTVASSAAAGSKITTTITLGNFTTVAAISITFVAVASDGMSLSLVGVLQVAPGTYNACVFGVQNAAGTFTFGSSLIQSQFMVELV